MSIALLILLSPLHVFVDGTSPVRLLLLGAYLIALAIVLRIRFREWSPVLQKTLRITAFASVALVLALSLFMQVWVMAAHDIPQRSFAVFFGNDEISSTRLTHTHTGKVAMAVITAPLAQYLVPVMDTGGALSESFNDILPILTAVLFCIALGTSLLAAPVVFHGQRKPYASFVLYGLVAFIVLQKSIDGGIANDGAFIALCAYAALLFLPARLFVRTLLIAAGAYLGGMTLLSAYGFVWGDGYALGSVFNAIILLLVCLALDAARRNDVSRRMVVSLALGAIVALGAKAYLDIAYKVAYLAAPLKPDASFVAAYPFESSPGLPQIGVVGRLAVFAADTEGARTLGQLIDQYHLPYWYQPVSRYEGSCSASTDILRATFTVHTPQPVLENTHTVPGLAAVSLVPLGTDARGWTRYAGTLVMHPCVPRRWDVVREMMREVGASRAVVFDFMMRGDSMPVSGGSGDK